MSAETRGDVSKLQLNNLKKERGEIDTNSKLRNASVTAVGKIISASAELTFEVGNSVELQEKLNTLKGKSLTTDEDRAEVLKLANELIKESDGAVKNSLEPLLLALKRENERIKAAKELLDVQRDITFEFGQQKTSIDAARIRRGTADEKISNEKQQALRSEINKITLDIEKRSRGPLSKDQSKAVDIQNAESRKSIIDKENQISKEDRESGQRGQFRDLFSMPGMEQMSFSKSYKEAIDGMSGDNIIKEFKAISDAVSFQSSLSSFGRLDGRSTNPDLDKLAAEIEKITGKFVKDNADAKIGEKAQLNLADAAIKAAGALKELALSQIAENFASSLRDGAAQGQFDTDRISDPVARLKAQISEDSREDRANAAQDPAEIRRILRSDEAKFRDIDDKMTIDPTERIKNRINERSQAARDSALDNKDFKEFRRLVEGDQFSGKLVDASAQFAHNIGDAMTEAIIQGGNLSDILIGTATSFFTTLSKAYMTKAVDSVIGKFAAGGKVTGGSGNRDDVPALLMGGEFVMKKSSVSKYGSSFMESLNAGSIPAMARGGLFTPGTNGQEEIKGKSNLIDFATQSFTTGASDRFGSGAGSASVNLEPQSAALTMFGRRNSPAFKREQDSKRDAFGLFTQQVQKEEEAREQKRQAKKDLKNAIIGAVVSAGFSSLATKFAPPKAIPVYDDMQTPLWNKQQGLSRPYSSGMVGAGSTMLPKFFATGGSVPNTAGVDAVPSMLSGGEFVMNAAATQKIGAGNLNALNSGAGGGSEDIVSKLDELISVSDNAGETVINITVNSDGSSDTQGGGGDGGGEQQRSLATRIKDVVKQVIDDEKRLGGSLRQARA